MSNETPPLFPANLDVQEARAAAVLGAGVWDVAPTEMYCMEKKYCTLYITYTRAAAGGTLGFRVEVSPRAVDDAVLQDWYQTAILAGGAVVGGADTTSLTQREDLEYGSTAAGAETFVYGPIELQGTVERLRVPCAEVGGVAAGTCQITAVFS